jgi:hypothetical protein
MYKAMVFLLLVLLSTATFAQPNFTAELVLNGTYLSIQINDDQLVPPFEAGELWKIIKGNDFRKTINENELKLNCIGLKNQFDDIFGNCQLLLPISQFQKVGEKLIFKANNEVAFRLNRYFSDSAYFSIQRNQVFLSSYNTRRLFYFGINSNLIK